MFQKIFSTFSRARAIIEDRRLSEAGFRRAVKTAKLKFDKDEAWAKSVAIKKARSLTERRAAFWAAPSGTFSNQADAEGTFQSIYDNGVWREGSGGGSVLKASVATYLGYLQHFIDRHDIKTIVDVGCGDWQFTRYLDLGSRHYLGVDIVPSVVLKNQAEFARPNVEFCVANASKADDFPLADLVICKDVLQHLSNENVHSVLARLRSARHAIITNDHSVENVDSRNGDTRPIDVTKAPFGIKAQPVLWFDRKLTVLLSCGG